MKLWCIVPVRNGPELLQRCLESIRDQDDPDLGVIVADDASTDRGMGRVLDSFSFDRDWHVIRRRKNLGALPNIVAAIRWVEETIEFDPADVVVLVDGDDRLLPGALARIREAFTDDVDFSYGSYIADPPDDGCPPAKPLPPDVLRYGLARAFARDVESVVNHPICFRRRLFDVLRDDDFVMGDGEPIRHAYDTALAMPMLEAAGERVGFIPDPIYCYSSSLPDSVHRVHKEEADAENQWVLNRPRKYLPVDWEAMACATE